MKFMVTLNFLVLKPNVYLKTSFLILDISFVLLKQTNQQALLVF